jgi:hypothetical protein
VSIPTYRVQVFKFADTTSYGVGDLLVEFENAKNLGWGRYLNDVSEAFFTVNQEDPKITLLRGYEGKAHVRIYRNSDLVWGGWLMEHDANADDVIFYCYGYESGLFWMHSDWDQSFTSSQVDVIVTALWDRAKTGLANSNLGWATTGTIEAPVTVSSGATALVLPSYKLYYKRILFSMRELAAFSMSDTTNTVVFEITPSGTFNFWKNRGVQRNDVVLRWGDEHIQAFSDIATPIDYRNEILAVGSQPNNVSLRTTQTSGSGVTTYGRRQESIYLSYVRDGDELDRVSKLRLARAVRTDPAIAVAIHPGTLQPPNTTGSPFNLSDTIKLDIDYGITSINAYYLVVGTRVVLKRGTEKVQLLLSPKPGS